jgi:hypothetical protein
MAVLASPAARAVRTACFAEQMQQKKILLASSQKSYPPAFHSLSANRRRVSAFNKRVCAYNYFSRGRDASPRRPVVIYMMTWGWGHSVYIRRGGLGGIALVRRLRCGFVETDGHGLRIKGSDAVAQHAVGGCFCG